MVYTREFLNEHELEQLARSSIECQQMIKEKKCSKADCKTCTKHEAMEAILKVADPYDLLRLDSLLKKYQNEMQDELHETSKEANTILFTLLFCVIGIPVIGGLLGWLITRICN